MGLEVVGAGLGRTGTNSLKLALERLLGGRCYHMKEFESHRRDLALWERAVAGEAVGWEELFEGWVATVDWPGAAFWKEISQAFPQAPVLLSTRESAQEWWESVERTIVRALAVLPPDDEQLARQRLMVRALMHERLTPSWPEGEAAMEAYERHNSEVRAAVPEERLIDWKPGDGWEPLCAALGVAVPDEPFPHVNTAAQFRATTRIEA